MTETRLATGLLQTGSRDLARLTLEAGQEFNLAEAMALVPPGKGEVIRATRDELQRSLRPLKEAEPTLQGSLTRPVTDSLSIIGMKVRPEMAAGEAQEWMKAVTVALSDLPPHCIRKAAAEAIHTPFQFLNQVEAELRALAERRVQKIRTAIRRLEAMMQEIIRAHDPPQPQLTDRTSTETIPVEEIRGWTAPYRSMALRMGFITQEQLDEAEAGQ